MKKRGGIKLAASVIIIILLGGMLFYFVLKLGGFNSFWDAFTTEYTEPDIKSTNAFLSITQIDVALDDKALGAVQCSRIAEGLSCSKGATLPFKITIKNNGGQTQHLYVKPRIGFECQDNGRCDSEEWVYGSKLCIYGPGNEYGCETRTTYTFTQDGTYTVYPAAICKQPNCVDVPVTVQEQLMVYDRAKSFKVIIS